MCSTPGEQCEISGYTCSSKGSPNRKGLGHIAISLKEILAHHVGDVPHGRESQKRNLQIYTEVNIIDVALGDVA